MFMPGGGTEASMEKVHLKSKILIDYNSPYVI